MAISYDGVSAYHSHPLTVLQCSTSYTVCAWLRRNATSTDLRPVVARTNAAPSRPDDSFDAITIGWDDLAGGGPSSGNYPHAVSYRDFGGGTWGVAVGTTYLTVGEWFHLTATFRGTWQRAIYTNGVQEGTDSTTAAGGTKRVSYAALERVATTRYANISIAEPALWTGVELSLDQILALGTGTRPDEIQQENLVIYNRFELASPVGMLQLPTSWTTGGTPAERSHAPVREPCRHTTSRVLGDYNAPLTAADIPPALLPRGRSWVVIPRRKPPPKVARVLRSEHRELRRRSRSRIRVSLPAARAVVSGGVAAVPVPRYYVKFRERYRIFNDAEYRFYRSAFAPPSEGAAPFDTASSLPHTPTATFGNGTWWISMSYFNGILDSGFYPIGPRGETYLRLDISGGLEIPSPPFCPTDWHLENRPAGNVAVKAIYNESGALRADEWAIWWADGATPKSPPNVPDITVTIPAKGFAVLDQEIAPFWIPPKYVRLATRRDDGGSWTYSANTLVKSITWDATGPDAPEGGEPWPGGLREEAQQ